MIDPKIVPNRQVTPTGRQIFLQRSHADLD
jgi:hypothetical protein